MQSERTRETIRISDEERERLHRSLAASNIEIVEQEQDIAGEKVKVTVIPHGTYIKERRRLAQLREKAHLAALRDKRRKAEKRQRDAKRQAKAAAKAKG